MKVYTYIAIILLLTSCGDKKIDNLNLTTTQKKNNDSIQNRINNSIKIASLDTIFRKEKDFHLKINKLENGFLKLDYKLKNEKKKHSFKMKYFDYSEVVFPINGVGHLDSKKLKLEKYSIYKDSILVLPIVSMPNTLSIYVIDLKNEKKLMDDFRTSLFFLWIRTKKGFEFIRADNPILTDSTYKYTLIKCRLNSNYLEDIKTDTIVLKNNINDDLKKQYELIKRF
ncbi:hypothetical protein [Flavobacterium ginsengiterrae]|uniref:Lipoprotein n=1 Tax=Flavobacterium ginsengiterrae TaxID=871695 RepID=A0ABP7GQP3_9FLAO